MRRTNHTSRKEAARLFLSIAAGIRSASADGEITGESVKTLIPYSDKRHTSLKHIHATLTWLLIKLCDLTCKYFPKFHR